MVIATGAVAIDCTLGQAGHARQLMERITPGGRLLGIDRDPGAVEAGRQALAGFGTAVVLVQGRFGNLDQLAWLPELVTTNAARAIGIEDYGLAEGCRADLVVLDARDAAQAITEQSEKLYVIKNGKVVARNSRVSELIPS